MKALVVFESMWGNTEQVARAIATGLAETMEVTITDVRHAPADPGDDIALIVVGGPTHAFSMSRASTRAEAHNRGATGGDDSVGLREWLDGLPSGHHTQLVATFDTRVDKVRHLPGSAAKSAARTAHRHGYPRAERAESFYVLDGEGPLLDGELARATSWGGELAGKVTAESTAR